MDIRYKALSVHLLTASGAVLSMFAMLAAVGSNWSLMFLWLVVALIVGVPMVLSIVSWLAADAIDVLPARSVWVA